MNEAERKHEERELPVRAKESLRIFVENGWDSGAARRALVMLCQRHEFSTEDGRMFVCTNCGLGRPRDSMSEAEMREYEMREYECEEAVQILEKENPKEETLFLSSSELKYFEELLAEAEKKNTWPLRSVVRDRGQIIEDSNRYAGMNDDAARHSALESIRAEIAGDFAEAAYRRDEALLYAIIAQRYRNVATQLRPNPNHGGTSPWFAPFEREAADAYGRVYGEGATREFDAVRFARAEYDEHEMLSARLNIPHPGRDFAPIDLLEFRSLDATTRAKLIDAQRAFERK
jgi:hypothetical protein